MITDDIVVNVVTNIVSLTLILFSIYPVLYIIRSMIEFISTAFDEIDTNKIFGGIAKSFKLKKMKNMGD